MAHGKVCAYVEQAGLRGLCCVKSRLLGTSDGGARSTRDGGAKCRYVGAI